MASKNHWEKGLVRLLEGPRAFRFMVAKNQILRRKVLHQPNVCTLVQLNAAQTLKMELREYIAIINTEITNCEKFQSQSDIPTIGNTEYRRLIYI